MPEVVQEPAWYRNTKGIACGTAAGIAITLAGHPFDTMKVRLQTQSSVSPTYTGFLDCVAKTIKWEGIGGLYKGVASPITGQVFFRTILFTSYYECQHRIKSSLPANQPLNALDYFKAGLITGFLASFADGPIDLFKSKMQYQIIAERMNFPVTIKYKSTLHCFTHTLQNYGLRGVYQGLAPTILRDTPGYCVFFGFNEYFKTCFAKSSKNPNDIGMLKFGLAAGISGLMFWHLTYNIDVIKSAMMADNIEKSQRKYKNMWDCAKKLYYNEGGYKRFWRGYLPCMLRAFPAVWLMLYVVDVSRKMFPSYENLRS